MYIVGGYTSRIVVVGVIITSIIVNYESTFLLDTVYGKTKKNVQSWNLM